MNIGGKTHCRPFDDRERGKHEGQIWSNSRRNHHFDRTHLRIREPGIGRGQRFVHGDQSAALPGDHRVSALGHTGTILNSFLQADSKEVTKLTVKIRN